VLTTHKAKAAKFADFYNALLGSREDRDTTIDLDALGVPSHDLPALDTPFSEEVWETVKHLLADKAPGPNGFTCRFYKSCWSIIKTDVMATISCVWAQKFMNMGPLNSAFIILIPKTEGAQCEGL
jgi:hypothetical protein